MSIPHFFRFLMCSALTLGASLAASQDFPTGTVRLIVPYPPGGGVDGLARPVAERLSSLWGKPVIVENKAGAATIIGSDLVAKATADGHTLLFTSDSSITSNPHLYANMPFDPIKDLAPVTQLIDLYQMVVVHPSVQASTLRELVTASRTQPLNYGSYGSASQPNLLFEALKLETGMKVTHIPYKGIAPALQATIANEVQATLGSPATTAAHVKGGRLKPLAISAPRRSALMPDVPTLQEAGFPDIGPRAWFGIFAPKGTSPAVLEKISKDVARVMGEAAFDAAQVGGRGYQKVNSGPKEFADFIAEDHRHKGRVIKQTGIKAE